MITIHDLQEQLIGELQGDVVVKRWNDDAGDFDFVTPLYEIPTTSPIMSRPIKYMYADWMSSKNSAVLCIEVNDEYT